MMSSACEGGMRFPLRRSRSTVPKLNMMLSGVTLPFLKYSGGVMLSSCYCFSHPCCFSSDQSMTDQGCHSHQRGPCMHLDHDIKAAL
uniref:Uncharacterized protein n=1 Tax=Arundo donax TaxID=35708 RepID=A0A0A9EV86_ARUDO